jgi:hypothetical protein
VVANHPSLINLSFPQGGVDNKTGRYFQIEGLNFADFTRKEMRDGPYFEKKIQLEDKIIVKQIR